MNIAVFHNLPSGGALRMLREKVKIFKKLSHRVHLFTFTTAEESLFPLKALVDAWTVEPLNFRGPARFKNYLAASRRLAKKIDASGVDKIWVEKCRFVGSPSILRFLENPADFYMQEPLRIRAYESLGKERSVGSTSSYSGPPLNAGEWFRKIFKVPAHFFIKREDRKSALAARTVYTNSNFSAQWIKRVYGIEARVLYQSVDTDFFSPHGATPENFVLSVGRLDITKGYDFLIEALSQVPKENQPALCVVCDAVNEHFKRRLQVMAAQKNVTLQIYTQVSDEVLRTLYQQCAFVMCAATHEPFGLVPLEAMACEKPVLAVKEGGFPETILDGETGYLLERNSALWAENIGQLLADKPQRIRLGRAGRRHVLGRWTVQQMNGAIKKCLE